MNINRIIIFIKRNSFPDPMFDKDSVLLYKKDKQKYVCYLISK